MAMKTQNLHFSTMGYRTLAREKENMENGERKRKKEKKGKVGGSLYPCSVEPASLKPQQQQV